MTNQNGEMVKPSILILFFILTAFVSWADDKIKMAYFQAQPHIIYNQDKEEISGALYTFLEEYIAPKMGIQFVWDQQPSNVPRQLRMLESGQIDATAILIWTDERNKKFSFSHRPFTTAKAVIGVLQNNSLQKISKVEDLLHLKIGYATGNYISPFMRDNRIKFEFVFTGEPNEQNFMKLKMGRIDAVYIPDKAGMLSEIKLLSMEKMVKVIELPDPAVRLHVVFTKKFKNLAEIYDTVYEEIDGVHLYQKLLSKYLDVNML